MKKNDLVSLTHYCKILSITDNVVNVVDLDDGMPFQIQGKSLRDRLSSGDDFTEEEKSTKTKVAELLSTSYGKPFTVCFTKADGSERKLRGRLVKPEPLMGRSHVEDLDITSEHKLRQVDHRSILWLIVDGKKHSVR